MMNKFILGSALLLTLSACSSDDDAVVVPEQSATALFNVVLSTSTTGNTATYVQALTLEQLSQGEISFNKYGFEVPSTRSARVYASTDGKKLYSLNYGGGVVSKFDVAGGQNYTMTNELNVAPTIGTEYPRWTKVDDSNALLHDIDDTHKYTDEAGKTGYQYTEAMAKLVNVNLGDLSLGSHTSFVVPTTKTDDAEKLYVSRIDAPVIAGGKAYYGVTKKKQNPEKPDESLRNVDFAASSLVVDYPSLKNPKMIESTVARGSTYGYRIPVAHQDERGDAYQLCKTHMLKLSNGDYDNSYVFDISKAMGFAVNTQGWFYAGNGIGYALYYDAEKGNSEAAAAWGIVRLDIYNKTAIKMNTPAGLYLFQHQHAKVLDGKVYMALCPVGGEGNIYIFDSKKADANGFELGAKLKTGAGASYLGIF